MPHPFLLMGLKSFGRSGRGVTLVAPGGIGRDLGCASGASPRRRAAEVVAAASEVTAFKLSPPG